MPKFDFNKAVKATLLKSNFDMYSPITLLYIFRTPFPKNISEGLLLKPASGVFRLG